ncbi:biopolymer transporter ExbD [Alphaproteobacteria bacterium]|nr:biopolymer transporter ExbD [Alphaproteobacteria bacterium]MDB2642161.1 biopolymer transporter ExbD [Alphaproteobacteria bacterium]
MQLARRQRRAGFMGLTPLIDMIFLLLLFFLLGSDFVTYGQSRLAPPRSTGGETSAAPPVVITLSADGALSWNGARVDAAFLRRETAKLTALNDEQMMVLMPAGSANVQQVTTIMDALQASGAQSIKLERDVFDIDLADF